MIRYARPPDSAPSELRSEEGKYLPPLANRFPEKLHWWDTAREFVAIVCLLSRNQVFLLD
jgi:hypothetical protein